MKKILIYILLACVSIAFLAVSGNIIHSVSASANNLELIWWGGNESSAAANNDKLQDFNGGQFIDVVWSGGEEWVYNTMIAIARDIKNLFYAIATVYFLVIVLKLIFASNTEEEIGNFKKWILWITIWLIIMQIAYAFALIMFDKWVSARLGASLLEHLVWPFIALLQTLASIFFIAVAVFAFYRLVTANGNEEAVKSGKMTILYAIVGFMIIRFARTVVEAFYGRISCDSFSLGFITVEGTNCINEVTISQWVDIIITILNYFNGFVAIVVMVMIIYSGSQILMSTGDEEKIKKAKSSLLYIAIGMFLLVFNYLLLTFFLVPEVPIVS